jgi:hypothetical protein
LHCSRCSRCSLCIDWNYNIRTYFFGRHEV